jgi:multidrug efflux system membrane fusion protein
MSGIGGRPEGQHIRADHQLPASAPWYRRRWFLWTSLLLLLIVAAVALWTLHKSDAKAATAKREQAAAKPSVTVTAVTATKGQIGIYLDAIGTVTPVHTTAITA